MALFDVITWESPVEPRYQAQKITVLHSNVTFPEAKILFQQKSASTIEQLKQNKIRYTLTEHVLIVYGKNKYEGINIIEHKEDK
jgi:hypothetical protein